MYVLMYGKASNFKILHNLVWIFTKEKKSDGKGYEKYFS